ncbi:MAG: hypothetical protein ACRDK3_17610 [Actinomycetota bacterium]
MVRRALLIVALLPLSACRPDTVSLEYSYEPGSELEYELVATATSTWDIGGEGEGSYQVTFDVSEVVESRAGDEAVIDISLTPTDVVERGLPSPGTGPRSFTLRVGSSGEVLEVLAVDDVPADSLDPDQLVFIGTYRPPVALEPVGLHDTWRSRQEVQVGPVFQQIDTLGTLESLDRDASGRFARIDYLGDGPLSYTTTLPQGTAELTGSAETTTQAILDLESGVLRRSRSTTLGRFEVRVAPALGGAPVTGTLEFELNLDLDPAAAGSG